MVRVGHDGRGLSQLPGLPTEKSEEDVLIVLRS
jgi:hypothetical protein